MKHFIPLVLVLAFMSSASAQDKIKVTPDRTKTLSAINGRFVFGQISDFRSDQYMLDTQTGRLWQIFERTDEKTGSSGRVLQIIPFVSTEGKLSLLPE